MGAQVNFNVALYTDNKLTPGRVKLSANNNSTPTTNTQKSLYFIFFLVFNNYNKGKPLKDIDCLFFRFLFRCRGDGGLLSNMMGQQVKHSYSIFNVIMFVIFFFVVFIRHRCRDEIGRIICIFQFILRV